MSWRLFEGNKDLKASLSIKYLLPTLLLKRSVFFYNSVLFTDIQFGHIRTNDSQIKLQIIKYCSTPVISSQTFGNREFTCEISQIGTCHHLFSCQVFKKLFLPGKAWEERDRPVVYSFIDLLTAPKLTGNSLKVRSTIAAPVLFQHQCRLNNIIVHPWVQEHA